MAKIDYKFLPLTFISSEEEIKRQITNTVIFFFLEEKFNDVVKLSQLLESTQYGYNTSALSSGENRFLRISDIKDGKVNWDTVPFCDCTDEESYLLYSKDILVARTGGTTGKSFLIKNPPARSVFAGYLIRLRTNKKLLPEFLNLFLNSYAYWSQISEMKSGSAQPNVNAEKLKQLLIPYCSVELQKEILSFLKDFKAEKGIWKELLQTILDVQEKHKKNNEVLELLATQQTLITQLRQSILQEAVQGTLTSSPSPRGRGIKGEGDEPASELLKRIKAEKEKLIKQGKLKKEKTLPPISESEIPYQLPNGWVWCRLGEITHFIDYRGKTPNKTESGIKLITAKNVKFGFFSSEPEEFISVIDYPKHMTRGIPNNGDLLFTTEAPLGNVCILDQPNKFALAQRVITMQPILLNNYYLLDAILSTAIQTQLLEKSSGMTAKGIQSKRLVHVLIPLPPLPEQKRIVEKVNQLMQHCNELEQQVQQSISHAQQLMQAVLREVFEKPAATGASAGKKKKRYELGEEMSLAAEE